MNDTWTPALELISPFGTASDKPFDGLMRLALRHFNTTVAMIALIDKGRLWLRSTNGVLFKEASYDLPPSAFSIMGQSTLVLSDALADERFNGHPLLSHYPAVRFYASNPMMPLDEDDARWAFCLLDDQPRTLTDDQVQALQEFADFAASIAQRYIMQASLESKKVALQERVDRMALAIDGSGTGVWDRNIQTNEIHYSSGWKAILGYSDTEISDNSFMTESYARVHPDDLAYVQAQIQQHFDRKTPSYEVEHRLRCKDGSYKWVSSRGRVISRNSQGEPLRMVGMTTDITMMRAMSERLQQTLDLVTNLTNEVPGLVFQYRHLPNGESFFPYTSAGIRDIYELEPRQLLASSAVLDELIHPDDRVAYHASFDVSAISLTPWHLEYRVQLPEQGLRWRQGDARPQRLADGSTLWHGFITDVTERKYIEAELMQFATIDSLTQLSNRRHFMKVMEVELARIAHDSSKSAAVLMCDLDYFKSINDTFGHAVGDMALRHFAGILRDQLRKTDEAGRVGGEEFAILLCMANMTDAVAFAKRLQSAMMKMPLFVGEQQIMITASIGITVMHVDDAGAEVSLSRSDMALYRAKTSGRNRIECHQ